MPQLILRTENEDDRILRLDVIILDDEEQETLKEVFGLLHDPMVKKDFYEVTGDDDDLEGVTMEDKLKLLAEKDQSLLVQCLVGKLAIGDDVPPNDTKISLQMHSAAENIRHA